MNELAGKVALITGASRGFGRAAAIALAGEGIEGNTCSDPLGSIWESR